MPTLYLVATPIGNLEDISYRAVRVLREVALIAAEDTRKTKRLLSRYGIATPMTSYYEYSDRAKLLYLIDKLQSVDVALVSEAGMPAISDPGYELVVQAVKNNIRVEALPGASAVVTAVAVSGLPSDRFSYLGFLPRRKGERLKVLESVAAEKGSLVLFATPHRLQSVLGDMLEVLGERSIAVCRELSKLHEEVFRGSVAV